MSELSVGIIALQGAVSEHLAAVKRAGAALGLPPGFVKVYGVRHAEGVEEADGIIMPGGESTTISKLLLKFGIRDTLLERAGDGMPLMGTCAGMVLMAKKGDSAVKRTGMELLGLMDMEINRNAFGRQRESFEHMLDIEGLDGAFPGVFIRAPAAVRTWGECRSLCHVGEFTVMAEQDNLMALAFHPELTEDTRIHRMFLEKVLEYRGKSAAQR